MTVSDMLQLTQETFVIIVKEPKKCFSYSCSSTNITQRDDLLGRRIYNITTIGGKMKVYCW